MKLTKKINMIVLVLAAAAMLAGCEVHSDKSYTFSVETGDKVKVKLDTSGDFDLSQKDGRFTVKEKKDNVLQGVFLTEDMYDQYMNAVEESGIEVLEEKEKDGVSYLFYKYEEDGRTETNFIVWINDSDTGVLIGSMSGEKKAKEGFERLSFEIEE